MPILYLNVAHIQAHGGDMDFLPELLRFRAMWCQFSSLEVPSRVSGLGLPVLPALPRHRYLKDGKELKTLLMHISLDSFRHFKGISRHKLVFLNKKIYIIIKPLDHEILFAPNINCRRKIFEQELASTFRQNMNSWTGNISAESREEGDSTSCCCFEKHVIGGMGRKRGGRCQRRADEEYEGNRTVSLYSRQCKAETTGNWERGEREWATRQRWLCRAAAQKTFWRESTAICPRGSQLHEATSLNAKPSPSADAPEPTSTLSRTVKLSTGLRLVRSCQMNQTEKTPRPVRTRSLCDLSKYWV